MCESVLGTGDVEQNKGLALTVSSVALGRLLSFMPLLLETDE